MYGLRKMMTGPILTHILRLLLTGGQHGQDLHPSGIYYHFRSMKFKRAMDWCRTLAGRITSNMFNGKKKYKNEYKKNNNHSFHILSKFSVGWAICTTGIRFGTGTTGI